MSTSWPHSHLDYDTFMRWAREAFEAAERQNGEFFPFRTPFETDFHFIGEDHVFTEKANAAMPRFIPRVARDGIVIPGGELAVISYVRKSRAYQEEAEPSGGVWTLDRVAELPPTHRLITSLMELNATHERREALNDVRQWFAIARFQATPKIRPPVILFVFGFIGFHDGKMGGVCPITKQIAEVFQVTDSNQIEIEQQVAYECCESLRQVAAIVYLETEKQGDQDGEEKA